MGAVKKRKSTHDGESGVMFHEHDQEDKNEESN